MDFWTIQSKKVLDIIEKEGEYHPDIDKSIYLDKFKKTADTELDMYTGNVDLYKLITACASQINNYFPLNGLVFCFCKIQDGYITAFKNKEDFESYMHEKEDAVKSLLENLNNSDHVLLHLEFNERFWNPLFIDINDYQFLMPPIIAMPPYKEEDVGRIQSYVAQGVCYPIFSSGIIQAHLPYITKSMIKESFEIK